MWQNLLNYDVASKPTNNDAMLISGLKDYTELLVSEQTEQDPILKDFASLDTKAQTFQMFVPENKCFVNTKTMFTISK